MAGLGRAGKLLVSPEVLGTGAGIAVKAIGTRLAFSAARGVFGEAGVAVTGAQLRNRALFDGALALLGLAGTLAFRSAWPRQVAVGECIRENFAAANEGEWQGQLELERPNGMPQVLLLRGSRLPEASGGGDVVVFDDVTRLVAGESHTCALRDDGTVWCWGSGLAGIYGDGTREARLRPTQVRGE